jgi:hypothetical protein
MHTGYYQGEKSVGLGPILLVLAAVTAISFGTVYFMFSHQVASVSTEEDATSTAQPSTVNEAPAKPHGNV